MTPFFKQFPEIIAVLTERRDGSMKVFPERPLENKENREKFFSEQGIPADRVVSADMVHGTTVAVVLDGSKFIVPGTDALVTKERNIFLSVTAADCLPIFFYDSVAGIVGIAHAGWKGVIGGVIVKTIEAMIGCGAKTEDIAVAFGPNIGKCHFEIQADILPQFAEYEEYVIGRDGKIFIDLQRIAQKQLQNAGIRETNIETTHLCTFCEQAAFFSYRRDKPQKLEVMAAVIGMGGK